ncbi:uncharacterized protein LOC123532726 [Mercenaria mercenaria]|uniref:uncharacterized protein LOC123532726 n=1 Tax=Mercenaria mercenaria TaxID=6596 RepID=UPI00234F6CA9|nr:uncharacterized protein LOC123532726 [Mercenaria mercenaria]
MLSSLLHITINGPQQKSEDASNLLAEATAVWRKTHIRNLPQLPRNTLPKVGGSDHSQPIILPTTESGVQTDPQAQVIAVDEDMEHQIVNEDCDAAQFLTDFFDENDSGLDSGLELEYDSDF